jgi:hypothetical protein
MTATNPAVIQKKGLQEITEETETTVWKYSVIQTIQICAAREDFFGAEE